MHLLPFAPLHLPLVQRAWYRCSESPPSEMLHVHTLSCFIHHPPYTPLTYTPWHTSPLRKRRSHAPLLSSRFHCTLANPPSVYSRFFSCVPKKMCPAQSGETDWQRIHIVHSLARSQERWAVSKKRKENRRRLKVIIILWKQLFFTFENIPAALCLHVFWTNLLTNIFHFHHIGSEPQKRTCADMSLVNRYLAMSIHVLRGRFKIQQSSQDTS